MITSMFRRTAMTVLCTMVVFAAPAWAQTPNATPAYAVHCSDCSGVEYFGELDAADTAGCQNYQHNLFENWTAEGEASPDPKFIVAAQADIVTIDQASDTDFWYYRIVTRAVNWNEVLLKNANFEMAFGDCSLATTRFSLLVAYDADSGDAGATWNEQGNGKLKFYRDSDSGNNRIGDTNNDGPAAPAGNTSDFSSNDDGYDTDVNVDADDAYSRLHTAGANATIEIAIRRTAAPLTALSNPFTPCFGRAVTGQTSTVSKDQFAINDHRPTSDFTSTSWAIDSCNGAGAVNPCDPAPDCTGSDTTCGIASCDPGGSVGNCDLLMPRAADTVCRADAGECDIAEVCDGVNTGACPADAFENAGTPCGDGSSTICDNADTCDGDGSCDPNFEPGSTLCRADAGECDIAENCDGAGSCPADSLEDDGTACGSGSNTVCDDPDTCLSGSCQPNFEPDTTLCRADTGECDVAENCDGAGSCPADAFEDDGTACGSSSDTVCDNPDTCLSGSCDPNNEPGSTLCRPDAGECDVAENCDGAGSCPADAFEDDGTACGSSSDTVCDNPDSCLSGSCEPNFEPGTTVCRADAGECDIAEDCDGAGSCPADAFEDDGTACGSSSDTVCDNPDSCLSGSCDPNNEPDTTVCRADAGECDIAENCDGGGSCPPDAFEDAGTTCGNPSDTICDNPDSCDASGNCLVNNEPDSTLCRADAGECDIAENCDGAGSCPADTGDADGTPCGDPSDTICDNADTCDGNGSCDPNFEPDSTLCRADAGECDVAENCDGAGSCPADEFEDAGEPCGSSVDTICDNPDTCDGDGTCEPNFEPGSTLCRADAGECDTAENCDGAGACPANVAEPEGTPCGSSADTICDNPDSCDDGGVCQPNNEPGSTLCRADAGECDVAENCDGAGSCPANGFADAGEPCGSSVDTICNNPDTCNGSGTCQQNFEPDTTVCRADAGECDVAENCDGAGACPPNEFEDAGTACGSASDTICDNPDTCDGSGECEQNFEAGGTLCRASVGECDPAEQCTGTTGTCPANDVDPDGTPCTTDNEPCTDDECDDGVCEHTPNNDSCNDGAFCTENDSCVGGTCQGTPIDCSDLIECTLDSCNESLNTCVHEGDNSQCDDDDPCTVDICDEVIGCASDLVCGSHICRTAGYWSTHSGYSRAGAINVGQEILDAIGGLDVCGQHVDSTSNLQSPWVQGLGLSSALEGLCVSVSTVTQRQLYRQLVAAGLNCGISGGDCDETLSNYIDVTFTECSELCATGTPAPGGPTVSQCIEQIDCFNNGGQLVDGKCSLGTCALTDSLCGGGHGKCPKIGGVAQACEPFPGNCHQAALCNEALGVCPKKTNTSSDKACKQAKSNNCTIDSCF